MSVPGQHVEKDAHLFSFQMFLEVCMYFVYICLYIKYIFIDIIYFYM